MTIGRSLGGYGTGAGDEGGIEDDSARDPVGGQGWGV